MIDNNNEVFNLIFDHGASFNLEVFKKRQHIDHLSRIGLLEACFIKTRTVDYNVEIPSYFYGDMLNRQYAIDSHPIYKFTSTMDMVTLILKHTDCND